MAASRFPGPMQFDDEVTFNAILTLSALLTALNPGTLGAVAYDARIDLGVVSLLSGAGAPTGDPGIHPAIYFRSDAPSADTTLYVCVATDVWLGAKLTT